MPENKMNEVAQLLGLELEEEFKIKDGHTKYKLTSGGIVGWSAYRQEWMYSTLLQTLLTGKGEIVKLPKQILDDVEKEYLSNIIKPFRDSVIFIKKIRNPDDKHEHIGITVRCYDNFSPTNMLFPHFEKGTMYKGMEIDKEYTLAELGL